MIHLKYLIYSAEVTDALGGAIQEKAEAPPTGFEDRGMVEMTRDPLCSSATGGFLDSQRSAVSVPPTLLLRRGSDGRAGPGS